MSAWKDITTFSQGETDRTPRSWQLKIDNIRLIVTQKWWGKAYSASGWSGWHIECEPFIRCQAKAGDDVEAIKAAALLELKRELAKYAALIGDIQ